MPRGIVCGDGYTAEADRIAVLDGAINGRARKLQLDRAFLSRVVPAFDQGLIALADAMKLSGSLAENNCALLRQLDEQTVMPRGVTGRRQHNRATIAEHILVQRHRFGGPPAADPIGRQLRIEVSRRL